MWMVRGVRGVLGVGGGDEKAKGKKLLSESEGSPSDSESGDSDSSWHSAEPGADELESFYGPTSGSDSDVSTTFDSLPDYSALRGMPANYYGANESDSAASTSSRYSRGNSRVKGSRKRSSVRSGGYSIPKIREESLETIIPRPRELRLDDEPIIQEDRSQSSRSSGRVRPERLRGGYELPRAERDESPSSGIRDLKWVQLQKLQRLQRDKQWGDSFPNKVEKKFSWPWKTLTEEQIALGKLDFNKFIVALSCCDEWKLQPEVDLTLDHINILHQLPLEEIPGYVNHEIAVSKGVQNTHVKKAWLKKDLPVSYECHVDRTGSCIIKIVKPKPTSTLLHREFGADRVMPVFINEIPDDAPTFAQNGIIVGLRRYRFWTYKNSGKEEFQNRNEAKDVDYQRAIKCFYICTESLADVDLEDSNFKYFVNIQAARSSIMHIHTVTVMAKYASRLQLPLSKSISADIDFTAMDEIKEIDDKLCKILGDSGERMSHTDGTGEISPGVAKMLPASVYKGKVDDKEGYPTLVQIRMFWEGMAMKGTFLVNHKLDKLRIHYRPSMVKVKRSSDIRGFQSINSLEVLNSCREAREGANLCLDLIVLLTLNKVKPDFFLQLLSTALANIQSLFTNRNAAFKELRGSTAESGLRDQTLRMLIAGIPLNHIHLQKNLKSVAIDKLKNLRRGCVPLPNSRYLMGTSDPTEERVLKRNQVAIAMGNGRICGKVLVYKPPGKHWGDVHLFDAVWDERLDPYVGPSKYTIFFSTNGDRPIVDEIANSDLDGDQYWVCNNTELISQFKPNTPWARPPYAGINRIARPTLQMSPNELEVALFNKFLKARFANGNSPPTMPFAAVCWLAHMDKYLELRDAEQSSPELGVVKKKIDELIEIFYRALDADKSGEEVELPRRLKPDKYPHFMEKENVKRETYTSTTILGQLHDMAHNVDAGDFCHPIEDIINRDPNFEFEGFENHKDHWRALFEEYNQEMSEKTPLTGDDETGAQKRDRIVAKYQEILKGTDKPLHQIWEEASALYYVNYERSYHRYFSGRTKDASMYGAFAIAGNYLCEIYARKEGVDPLVYANSVRVELSHG
ncbi:hypothetical protein KC19_10G179300 [Ceratodon purpureus]|uniref:RNA-dependent RNA polymerase n=1 Tax=Ceratodon purpureus TaxID=3225 RepID=A0A8T0GN20_CERPU|nr:hypothetical protein KC19_10G179300 [Ceratodon purpureus]KAG0560419.1 hypothetical protein KC19_10G179300 [Ceratodon purpureus]KAG0560420.1 hypothetical protein KC19_10G179300 [Ceratodon purpureus]